MFTVLVVDGDDQFLSSLRENASTWSGVEIETVDSVREAEEFLRKNPCDTVISEYVLPDKDGIDLLRHIRSRYGKLPFILLTGHGSEEVAAEASRYMISAYIRKIGDPLSIFSEIYGKIRVEMSRKEAVSSLRERESRCRTILESHPGLICRFGPDLVLTFVNRTFAEMCAKPPADLVDTSFSACIHEKDQDKVSRLITALTPGNPSLATRLLLCPFPGAPERCTLTEWTFTAAFSDEGYPVVIQGTGRDLSREQEKEEQDRLRVQNLEFLSQTAMEFVDMEDSDDIYQFIAERIHGIVPGSIVGIATFDPGSQSVVQRTIVADQEILSIFLRELGTSLIGQEYPLQSGPYAEITFLQKGINEGPPLFHLFFGLFPQEACSRIEEACSLGKSYVMGFSSRGTVFADVVFMLQKGKSIENPELLEAFVNQASVALLRWQTRKAAEEEVARIHAGLEQNVAERTAELQAANRNLESFSYSISHDLRAPLRSIEGFSSIFLQQYGKDISPEGKQLIDKVRKSTARMAELIDAILEFSRTTRQDLRKEAVDMQTLATEVLDEQIAARPGQKVERVITALPPCQADRILLRQVLQNLIANALKFSRTRETSRIEVGSLPKEGHPVYYVRDNGIGFDMAYADRLFRVFERLHESRAYEGTGIGLAITDQIIRRHGGRIWAQSGIDDGSTFYFTLGE
jgi:signal transduction histidine kinase/PAS domain-containing protein